MNDDDLSAARGILIVCGCIAAFVAVCWVVAKVFA